MNDQFFKNLGNFIYLHDSSVSFVSVFLTAFIIMTLLYLTFILSHKNGTLPNLIQIHIYCFFINLYYLHYSLLLLTLTDILYLLYICIFTCTCICIYIICNYIYIYILYIYNIYIIYIYMFQK